MYCYAPEVRLDSNETYNPMGTDEFVEGSALDWAHDGLCKDDELAPVGSIDALALGQGHYMDRQEKSLIHHCARTGKTYNSAQLTRPSQSKGKVKGLDRDEGFYLNLDNKARHGDIVTSSVTAPLTYSYKAHKYVVYWFMYGFNEGAPGIGALVDRHEGEWERVAVLLNSTNHATSVDFFQHLCNPAKISWAHMTDKTEANGHVVDGTHPVVFSADGSHASYPIAFTKPSKGIARCKPSGQGKGDFADGRGAYWDTWQVKMQNAASQAWYHFGGAWGEVGSVHDPRHPGEGAVDTSPLGPPWKKPLDP